MSSSEATPAATAHTNDRVRERIEKAIPDEAERRAALELLAYAIENADDGDRRLSPAGRRASATASTKLALGNGRCARLV